MTALAALRVLGDLREARALCERALAAQRCYAPHARPAELDQREGIVLGALSRETRLRRSADGRWLVAFESPAPDFGDRLERLLRREGLASLGEVDDHYALIAWDGDRRRLFAARSVTGQVPLFVAGQGAAVRLASTIRGLAATGPLGDLRLATLAAYAGGDPPLPGEGFWSDARPLPPGCLVEFTDDGPSLRPLAPPRDERPFAASDDLCTAYRDCLDACVGSALAGATGPVAAQLSAGFDSSSVVATAARLGAPGLRAYTAGLAGRPSDDARRFGDETGVAAETAAALGISHEAVRPTERVGDLWRRLTPVYDMPLRNPLNLSWWSAIRRRAAAEGATLMLTGEMGNLTLNRGGLSSLADYLRRGQLPRFLAEFAHVVRRPDVSLAGAAVNALGPWVPAAAMRAIERRWQGPGAELPSLIRPQWLNGRSFMAPADLPADPAQACATIIAATDVGMYRAAARADGGIGEVDPLSDPRAIRFGLRLPPEALLRHGVSRPLAKAALADRLGPSVLAATRRGQQSADWWHRVGPPELRTIVEEVTASATVCELLDLPAIDRLLRRWPSAPPSDRMTIHLYRDRLLAALSVGIFIRHAEHSSQASGELQ